MHNINIFDVHLLLLSESISIQPLVFEETLLLRDLKVYVFHHQVSSDQS